VPELNKNIVTHLDTVTGMYTSNKAAKEFTTLGTLLLLTLTKLWNESNILQESTMTGIQLQRVKQ
jgi:hypothetical protein